MDSSATNIRAGSADDWDAIAALLGDAFHHTYNDETRAIEGSVFEPERSLVAEDAGLVVGHAAAFTRDLRHRIVRRLLIDIDARDMRAFPRKQRAHRSSVADRRILVDDFPLPRTDHDDPAPGQSSAARREPERFRMQ